MKWLSHDIIFNRSLWIDNVLAKINNVDPKEYNNIVLKRSIIF